MCGGRGWGEVDRDDHVEKEEERPQWNLAASSTSGENDEEEEEEREAADEADNATACPDAGRTTCICTGGCACTFPVKLDGDV